nr:hypothetical protein Hi04_10k_c2651_00002 [uncultured bacterium]
MPRPPGEKRVRGRPTPLALVLFALAPASLATAHAAGAEELRPYRASYEGIWHGMVVAVSHLKLERTGDTWTFGSVSEPRGIGRLASGIFPPREISVVRVTADGVLPQSFKSAGGDRARATDLVYDWQARRVSGTYEGIRRDWENPGGREFLKTKGPRDTPIFIG